MARKIHEQRLDHAKAALQATPDYHAIDDQSALGDLLANLMHYAKRHRLDWDAALHMGEVHFVEEQEESRVEEQDVKEENDGPTDRRTG